MIVSLSPGRDRAEAIRQGMLGYEVLDTLEVHWLELKGEALLPNPDDLFLGALATAMPNVILSFYDEGLYSFAYAGLICRDFLGLDPAGLYVDPEMEISPLDEIAAHVLTTHHRARPVVSRHLGCVCLHLPFGTADGEASMILTGLVPQSDARHATVVRFPG